MKMLLFCLWLLAVALPIWAQDASPAASSPPEAVERLREIGIEPAGGAVPAYASAGHEARGQALGADVAAALDFLEASFGVRPPVVVAVLHADDWGRVTPAPYGLPHFHQGAPNVVVLGATHENEAAEDLRGRHDHASAEDRQRVRRAGLSWDEASGRLLDLVAYHELGHLYTHALGIAPHRRWFSEMLATYFGYAFMRSERPEDTLVWEGVLGALASSPQPAHTSLADFEELYVRVGVPNYQDYQAAFHTRVAEVYDAQGLGFIERVREALPAGSGERLSTDALLARLERIQPGFQAWAEGLGSTSNP
jgi:hypothetical protein